MLVLAALLYIVLRYASREPDYGLITHDGFFAIFGWFFAHKVCMVLFVVFLQQIRWGNTLMKFVLSPKNYYFFYYYFFFLNLIKNNSFLRIRPYLGVLFTPKKMCISMHFISQSSHNSSILTLFWKIITISSSSVTLTKNRENQYGSLSCRGGGKKDSDPLIQDPYQINTVYK